MCVLFSVFRVALQMANSTANTTNSCFSMQAQMCLSIASYTHKTHSKECASEMVGSLEETWLFYNSQSVINQ